MESLAFHIWGDGCAGQFRSRFAFSLLCKFAMDHTLFWYYNERHHGKGPIDGIGGTINNQVFRDVKYEKVIIRNAKHFASHPNSILKSITSVYMLLEDVLVDPESVNNAPRIPGTLEVHKISRSFNSDGMCKLIVLPLTIHLPMNNGIGEMVIQRYVFTQNYLSRLTRAWRMLNVTSPTRKMKMKSGWNVTSVTNGSMKIAFTCKIQSIKNEPSNIFQTFYHWFSMIISIKIH